jgi:hypothetical protein
LDLLRVVAGYLLDTSLNGFAPAPVVRERSLGIEVSVETARGESGPFAFFPGSVAGLNQSAGTSKTSAWSPRA